MKKAIKKVSMCLGVTAFLGAGALATTTSAFATEQPEVTSEAISTYAATGFYRVLYDTTLLFSDNADIIHIPAGFMIYHTGNEMEWGGMKFYEMNVMQGTEVYRGYVQDTALVKA
ncbi:TPA: hypothetical protein IUV97_001324 [Enterococcus faecalis]|nr:hypothetical protein [Enterococcus faecalis]